MFILITEDTIEKNENCIVFLRLIFIKILQMKLLENKNFLGCYIV
jgi:hypothetical protein